LGGLKRGREKRRERTDLRNRAGMVERCSDDGEGVEGEIGGFLYPHTYLMLFAKRQQDPSEES
jgi:hypothetical protein